MLSDTESCKKIKKELNSVINNLKPNNNIDQCKQITNYLMSIFWNDYYTGQEFLIYHSNLRENDIEIVLAHWKSLIKNIEEK